MKTIKYLLAVAPFFVAACGDIDDMVPEGGSITEAQLEETVSAVPERVSADLAGMYFYLGKSGAVFNNSSYHNDGGYPAICLAMDANSADMVGDNSGYNWFSPSFEYSDRSPNYIIPYMRYTLFYNNIKQANDLIASIPETVEDETLVYTLAQARAMRAWNYMHLAPYFQWSYTVAPDAPCIPLVTPDTPDAANNPRVTVREVYEFVLADLDWAVAHLEGYQRASKGSIDQQVAYGIRARAHLAMGMWEAAAEDAAAAMQGYEPASIAQVSKPAFCELSEPNWMWGILIEKDKISTYRNGVAHLVSFSGDAYTAGVGCYKCINSLLYAKIPSTDVRKGWWVNEEMHSPLLSQISWDGTTGDDICALTIEDVKVPFTAYTNVKFGMKSGIGSVNNDNDWPLMRVEEMILVRAEGLAMSGQTAEAKQVLEDFVKTYRDPSYTCMASSAEDLQTEIWKQRRIELWGEGFAMWDVMRLHRNIVRFHDGQSTNWPAAFAFNISADDPYLLLRFPQSETNTNAAVTPLDNAEGSQPKAGQNAGLMDGVTD